MSESFSDLEKQLLVDISKLRNYHSVLLMILVGLVVAGWFTITGYNRRLASAQEIENQYKQERQQLQSEIQADMAERQQWQRTEATLADAITKRTQENADLRAEIQKASTPKQVAAESKKTINVQPTIAGNTLCYTPDQVKVFLQDAVLVPTLQKNFDQLGQELGLEQKQLASLTSDLQRETTERLAAEKSLAAYKSVAKRGKLHALFAGALHIGEVVGVAVVLSRVLK